MTERKEDIRWKADPEQQNFIVEDVRVNETGYTIEFGGCRIFWLSKEHGVVPEEGDELTLISKPFGAIRGVVLNDVCAYYRTEEEVAQHYVNERFGVDAETWLKRWDEGKGVWTVKMGGLSPGYDQCIDIMTAEFLRALLKLKPEIEDGLDTAQRHAVEEEVKGAADLLGLSGAQYGAALGLALRFYKFGPVEVLTKMEAEDKDRLTQASKAFPHLETLTLRQKIDAKLEELGDSPVGLNIGQIMIRDTLRSLIAS